MKHLLFASLLLFGGCTSSRNVPPPVSPTARPAEATGAASPAPAPVTHEMTREKTQREIAELLDNPDLTPEDKRKILEVLLQPQHDHAPDPAGAGPASDAAKPAGDDVNPMQAARDPGGAPASEDVRPPVAGDLAEYTKDISGKGPLVARIDTSLGAFHCKLFTDKAPMTVANFVGLATGKKAWQDPRTGLAEKDKPFYEGLIFHRVIPGFGVQSGDPLGLGTGGPGYQFDDEVNNGLTMKPGTLLMANAGPSTNGSQFFITEGSPQHLNNKHTIFGQCREIDLVKRIARVPSDSIQRPITPITINKITFSKI